MKKSIIAAILVLAMVILPLTACGGGGGTTGTAGPGGDNSQSPGDVTTAEPAFDSSGIVGNSYGKINEEGVVYLTFDGDEAEMHILRGGKGEVVTGKYAFTKDTFTIGDRAFTFKAVSTFFNLTDSKNDKKYPLTVADEEDMKLYTATYALLTGKWSGDGMTIKDNGDGTMEFSVGGSTMNAACSYKDYAVTLKQAADESAGTGNLAEGATVTSSGKQGDTYLEEYAVDGIISTRFSSAYSGVDNPDGAWLTLDLGAEKTFSCVNIYWETACGKDYEIQVSDDNVNWLTVFTMTGNTKSGSTSDAVVVHSFDKVTARYVRMQGVARNTKYGYSIYEIEVLAAALTNVEFTYAMDGDNLKITYENKTYTLTAQQ